MRIAVCPGSFDPVTLGHLDIIDRASKLFDKVIVLVSFNANKSRAAFTPTERMEMIIENMFLSSSVVKEIASFGGDITGFVPKQIQSKITDRLYKPANNIDQ